MVKNPPSNAGDVKDGDSVPGSGRSPGGGNDNPLQYYCLENFVDSGAWWAAVHGGQKESDMTEHACVCTELRKMLYLLLLFIIKDTTQIVKWKRCIRQIVGKGAHSGCATLSASCSV